MATVTVDCYPTANGGTLNNWSIGGSAPPANPWEAVDETSANDGVDYILQAPPNASHEFLTAAPSPAVPAGSTAISVAVHWRGQRTAAGANSIAPRLLVGTTVTVGTITAQTTSWATYSDDWGGTNPSSSAAWTVDEVNGIAASHALIGVGVSGTGLGGSEEVRCTQLFLRITYTEAVVVVVVGSPDRTTSVAAASRTTVIPAELRTVAVPAASRTVLTE